MATMERKILQEFIEIYRSETSLWKVKSCNYNNKTIKNMAYCKLLAKLRELYPDADIELVKKKINALRTNFRKELRKVEASREKNKQTGEALYVPSLWYYKLFHFIEDQENELKGDVKPAIDVEPAVDMVKLEMDESVYYDDESDENFDEEFQASSPESVKPMDSNSRMPQSSMENLHQPMMPVEYTGYKRKRDVNYDSSNEWHPKIQSCESYIPNSSAASMDDCEIFGQYVASKLRKMDKSMQLLSEKLISEVLFWGHVGELSRSTIIKDEQQFIRAGDSTQN